MSAATNSGDRIAGFTVQADTFSEIEEKYNTATARVKVLDPDGFDIIRRDLFTPIFYEN